MLHDYLVSLLWPGAEPVAPGEYRDLNLLSSAAARPIQTAFGAEIYDSIFKKAAALFHSLIANHPFHNGNKRTAVIAVSHFLLANNYFLALTPSKMYELAKAAATYRERGLTHEEILSQILDPIESTAVPLPFLKQSRYVGALYNQAVKARLHIRQHPLNQPQPGHTLRH